MSTVSPYPDREQQNCKSRLLSNYYELFSLVGFLFMYETHEFASAYSDEKENHPFRTHMERHTIQNLIENLKNKRVLDIACGAGNYSRLFCKLGATKVTGVDSSLEMIKTAIANTPKYMPIEYLVCDGENYRQTNMFDVVFHSYFLNYASSLDSLNNMCHSITSNLKDNGFMLGVVSMLGREPSGAVDCCDFYTNFRVQPREGEEYDIVFRGQSEVIKNYNWSMENYENSLRKSGLSNIVWHKPMCNKTNQMSDENWSQLINHPVFMAVTAIK